MRVGLATSLAFHAVLITLGVIGLHGAEELAPMAVEAISVDLVPIEEIASIRAGSEQSTVIETPAPAVVDTPTPVELAERPGATQADQPNPEETTIESPAPTVETAPEPAPAAEPEPEPEPPPPEPEPEPEPEPAPPAPAEPEPDPVLAAAPTEEAPTETAVPIPAMRPATILRQQAQSQSTVKRVEVASAEQPNETEPADQVSDIINTEASRGSVTGEGGQAAAGRPTGQAARLTQSELGALIAQMRRCWNPTLSERNDGVVIQLMVSMNPDGTVAGMPQILSDATGLLGISARTAARKVADCGPFALPDDKYDHWREIDVTLDASQAN
ncbi:MAG: hypothetical protein KKH72_10590 [Alphaproteobacteria bacterium]|nr:hypothetical protein [Alphaproteobacteria bacterium]